MVLEHLTSKNAKTYLTVLDVLIMEKKGNLIPFYKVKKRSSRNRTLRRKEQRTKNNQSTPES